MYSGQITNWREVGGEDRPIVLLSRETNSGTHVYFLENVLRLGQKVDTLFSPDTLLLPSSEGISAEVRQNPNAIGYDGLGYVTADMKTVAVSAADGRPFVLPTDRHRQRQNVSHRARPVHVHRRRANRRGERLPGLDHGAQTLSRLWPSWVLCPCK